MSPNCPCNVNVVTWFPLCLEVFRLLSEAGLGRWLLWNCCRFVHRLRITSWLPSRWEALPRTSVESLFLVSCFVRWETVVVFLIWLLKKINLLSYKNQYDHVCPHRYLSSLPHNLALSLLATFRKTPKYKAPSVSQIQPLRGRFCYCRLKEGQKALCNCIL